jgi:hypothetical protein
MSSFDIPSGDDIKEKVKELDAEFSIGRKIGKNNREPGERTRRSFVPNNRGGCIQLFLKYKII